MTVTTNATSSGRIFAVDTGRAARTFLASTVEEWGETTSIVNDGELMADVQRGLDEADGGGRLYSFEEVFGEGLAE